MCACSGRPWRQAGRWMAFRRLNSRVPPPRLQFVAVVDPYSGEQALWNHPNVS